MMPRILILRHVFLFYSVVVWAIIGIEDSATDWGLAVVCLMALGFWVASEAVVSD